VHARGTFDAVLALLFASRFPTSEPLPRLRSGRLGNVAAGALLDDAEVRDGIEPAIA